MGHSPDDWSYVAKKILGRVAVVVDALEELPGEESDDAEVAKEEINDLLQRAIDSGGLSAADRDLLLDLAHAAASTHAPDRRGRGGLMTPSVTQMVQESHAMSSRSVRPTRQVRSRPFRRRPDVGDQRCEVVSPPTAGWPATA